MGNQAKHNKQFVKMSLKIVKTVVRHRSPWLWQIKSS